MATLPKEEARSAPRVSPEASPRRAAGPTGIEEEEARRAAGPTGAGDSAATRCGFVALIGAPNAGKSTLINRLVGTKVSIVSHKVQTTRSIIRGIAMAGAAQIIFVDTPGIFFHPKKRLERAMVATAWGGARDADLVALLIDAAKGMDDGARHLLAGLAEIGQPKLLILNKIDAIARPALLQLAEEANRSVAFQRTFMLSALTGDGVDDFLAYLAATVPTGPWLYPEDEVSDLPLRNLAAEITREKLLERLHQEIPYAATVETERWTDQKDGSARIEQTIYVERDSQKKIVIGRGGATIKAISTAARTEIAALAERPVHLFLFVKVRKNWADDPERYREMGIEFPKD
jgi:GTPase